MKRANSKNVRKTQTVLKIKKIGYKYGICLNGIFIFPPIYDSILIKADVFHLYTQTSILKYSPNNNLLGVIIDIYDK